MERSWVHLTDNRVRLFASALLFIAVSAIASCNATQRNDGEAVDLPNYVTLAAAHNERVERLRGLYSRGVIELRWRDERGRHFEQGDLDFYLQMPSRTAFRVTKLGDTYLWFGSDESLAWLFDLTRSDDRVLHLSRSGGSLATQNGELSGLIPPILLIELMGLTPLPETDSAAATVRVEASRDPEAWVVIREDDRGTAKMFLDRSTLLPARVELHAPDQARSIISTIQRPRSVHIPGVSQATLPRMGTLIDVEMHTSGDPPQAQDGTMKIALSRPTADLSDQPMDRVFDLSRLRQALRPHRIESDSQSADTHGVSDMRE